MSLSQSEILNVTIRKLLPVILIFSFYMFSYGSNYPGGGFQAGVIVGTIAVIFEILFEDKLLSDFFYSIVEITGLLILITFLTAGIIFFKIPFGDFYGLKSDNLIYSSIFLYFINLSIYLEVSGSMVLIFRNFIGWLDEKE